ncbi:MAG: hypothetical protein ABSF23_16400 [Terracidiphilus sp.]|jgi:hypothetical protein
MARYAYFIACFALCVAAALVFLAAPPRHRRWAWLSALISLPFTFVSLAYDGY